MATASLVTLALVLAAVVFSPLILRAMLGESADWAELSNMGQAYGGIAAVLAAIALMGIAVSLFLQWKQARLQQIFAVRERHFELMRLGLEQPGLMDVFAEEDEHVDPLIVYANLFVIHLVTLWDLDEMPENTLRRSVTGLFRSRVSRDWWRTSGPSFSDRLSRRRARFHSILDEECQLAEARAAARRAHPGVAGEHASES